jgi:hypothetical protein
MLVRRGLSVLFFAGVALWSGLAEAQYFNAEPTVRLSGGYTFNRFVSADPALDPYSQSSPLVTIAPSLALTYDTPLVQQRLTISSTLGLPLASDFTFNGQPPSYNLKLNYNGTIPLDPLTKLTLTGTASAAPINGFTTQQDASLTPIEAPPFDFTYNLTFSGSESLRRELSESASLTQTTTGSYTLPFNVDPIRASTLTIKNSLALTRKWTLDTLTLTGSVGVTRFGPAETNAGVTDTRVQILNDLALTWRRPFTEDLTGSLNLGVGQTISPGTTVPPVWQPTGGAQLSYDFAPVTITLVYGYSAMVDVYTASTNLNNHVTLRATLPLSTTGFSIAGSGGLVHLVPIAGVGSGSDSVTSDIGLTYAPVAIPKLSVSLRGIYSRQAPLDNPLGAVTRWGTIFNVSFSYPNTKAVDFNARLAPAFIPTNFDGDVKLGQDAPAFEFAPPVDAGPPEAPSAPAPPVAPAAVP